MHKSRKILYWVITGIFLSLALSSVILTRDGSLQQFYDDGYVQDLEEQWMRSAYCSGQYDVRSKMYTWSEGDATCYIGGYEWTEEMHYLVIDAALIDGEAPVWKIYYRDINNQDLAVDEFTFQNGECIIPIKEIEGCSLLISLWCNGEVQYQMNDMRLMEYTTSISGMTLFIGSVICFAVYCILSMLLLKRLKPCRFSSQGVVEGLEQQADYLLQHLNHSGSREAYAKWVRTVLIVGIVIVWRLANDYGINRYYGYAALAHMVLFLALVSWIPIGAVCRNVNDSILKVWLALCGIQILSDILLQKNYGFVGLWSLICFGLLYRAWRRMEEPENLLEDFVRAVEILYLINIMYCLKSGYRSNILGQMDGTWGNTNPFAITVVLYLTVMLYRLYQVIQREKSLYYLVEVILGIGLGIWMLYKADCRTAWLAFVVVTALFILRILSATAGKKQKKRKWWLFIAAVIIILVGSFLLLKLGDIFIKSQSGRYSFNDFTSGRISIWLEYLKQINLLGHSKLPVINGVSTFAHNSLLKIIYKYGFLAGILVLILLVEILSSVVKIWKTRTKSASFFLVVGILAAYVIPVSLESINEYPMVVSNWFAFYFIVGYLIQEKSSGMVEDDG